MPSSRAHSVARIRSPARRSDDDDDDGEGTCSIFNDANIHRCVRMCECAVVVHVCTHIVCAWVYVVVRVCVWLQVCAQASMQASKQHRANECLRLFVRVHFGRCATPRASHGKLARAQIRIYAHIFTHCQARATAATGDDDVDHVVRL